MINQAIAGRNFFALAMLMTMAMASQVLAQVPENGRVRDYFFRQEAGDALLIRINGFEAEYAARVMAPGGTELAGAGVAHNRLAPLFLFISESEKSRQVDIQVISSSETNRARFHLEPIRISVRDQRSGTLARAYQLLSFGLQPELSNMPSNWSVRSGSLLSAADIFRQFGMEEMRLWALYYAAHLAHFQLSDHNTALQFVDEILQTVRRSRFQTIELAAVQLQGAALIAIRNSQTQPLKEDESDPVQSVLALAVGLAGSQDLEYEQALALFRSAEDYAARDMATQALTGYQQALDIADALAAGELATGIGESLLKIHGSTGDVAASGEVLQAIETQLADEGAGDVLAQNLLRQGQLLLRNFRYPEAVVILRQALTHEHNSLTRSQVYLALAEAHYQVGQLDEALVALRQAGIVASAEAMRRPNLLLAVGEGLRMLADIYRQQGQFREMREAREAQRTHLSTAFARAGFAYDRGLDALAVGGAGRSTAQSWFDQARQAETTSPHAPWGLLGQLQLCLLTTGCTVAEVQKLVISVEAGGVPRHVAEAHWLQAQFLAGAGQRQSAHAVLESLLADTTFYRRALPGVLGAWQWQRLGSMYDLYLDWAIALPGEDSRSLLALARVQFDQRAGNSGANPAPVVTDQTTEVRASLARIEEFVQGDRSAAAPLAVAAESALRVAFDAQQALLSRSGVQQYLQSMGAEECLLAFHVSTRLTLLWFARDGVVKQYRLAGSGQIASLLEEALGQSGMTSGKAFDRTMESLGDALLAPVRDQLTNTIYWLPSAGMAGLPLDAIRLNGRYLAEQHDLAVVLAFPSRPNPAAHARMTMPGQVFLAGRPQDFSGEYVFQLVGSPELDVVKNRFVGPGLQIIRGEALLLDEFQVLAYRRADLLHLFMPGQSDRSVPERSRLVLSEAQRGGGRTALGVTDILANPVVAQLVVLSAVNSSGLPGTGEDDRPVLAGAYLDAGAGMVISSLWSVSEGHSAGFTDLFYGHLETSGNVVQALALSKRSLIASEQSQGLNDWARFQLYMP